MRRLAPACFLALAGCALVPSSSQRLTEAVLEMNTATRFGRMDVALDRVGARAREDFLTRHAGWGSRLRVVDVEFGGFDMTKRDEANVYLDVTWLRVDEATVRSTRISQRWRDERGHWELIGEERKEGDAGLLGEPQPVERTPSEGATGPARMSLQTRVIQGD